MLVILQADGFQGGGINFDAKTRRNSTDLADIFYAHISGVDTFARALLAADKLLTTSQYTQLLKNRYASFNDDMGLKFSQGKLSLEDLFAHAQKAGEPKQISGQQELFEMLLNNYC